jgi:hypothetical protein
MNKKFVVEINKNISYNNYVVKNMKLNKKGWGISEMLILSCLLLFCLLVAMFFIAQLYHGLG